MPDAGSAMVDTDPAAVGLCAERLERIDGWMNRLVDEGRLAGLSVMVARRGRTGGQDAVAPQLVVAAREAGFVVNAPTPNAVRLAPPLVISDAELDTFVDALPTLLDRAGEKETS